MVGRIIPETGETDVDEEVGAATGDKKDTDRRDCRGEESQVSVWRHQSQPGGSREVEEREREKVYGRW